MKSKSKRAALSAPLYLMIICMPTGTLVSSMALWNEVITIGRLAAGLRGFSSYMCQDDSAAVGSAGVSPRRGESMSICWDGIYIGDHSDGFYIGWRGISIGGHAHGWMRKRRNAVEGASEGSGLLTVASVISAGVLFGGCADFFFGSRMGSCPNGYHYVGGLVLANTVGSLIGYGGNKLAKTNIGKNIFENTPVPVALSLFAVAGAGMLWWGNQTR